MPSKGTTNQRGYGHKHQAARKQAEPLVRAGRAMCWRCLANGLPPAKARIHPREPWDMGHHPTSTPKHPRWAGPEHRACNRATRTHAAQRRRATPPPALAVFDPSDLRRCSTQRLAGP